MTTAFLSLLPLIVSHGNCHAREIGGVQCELQSFKKRKFKNMKLPSESMIHIQDYSPKPPAWEYCFIDVYKDRERSSNLRRWQQVMLTLALLQLLRNEEPQALLFFFP